MKYLLLLLCLCARADWKADQRFYWFNNTTPGVAITPSVVHDINHAVGSVTSVQIGDQTGVLASYCTGFTDPSSPCGSVQNCTWPHTYNNVVNDALNFLTCRPMTVGITYIATNYTASTGIVWFSAVSRVWITGTITSMTPGFLYTLPDSSKAWYGTVTFNGQQAVSGDSGSPVFNLAGDFIGSVAALDTGQTVAYYLYPAGATYRPIGGGGSIGPGFGSVYDDDD